MRTWETEILTTLASHVRVLSLSQAAKTWWPGQRRPLRQARRTTLRLAAHGWLQIHQALSRPIVELMHPLVEWHPGREVPAFATVSRHLHRRAMVAAGMTTVVTATRRSRELFGRGGGPRRVKLTQMTHDLQVTEVFLAHRHRGLGAYQWVGEDDLPANWQIRQRPDAVLLDDQGVACHAIEYGGDYSVDRLGSLHAGLAGINLSYEIW